MCVRSRCSAAAHALVRAKHDLLLLVARPLTALTLTSASAATDAMEAVKQGSACVGCRVRVLTASCVRRSGCAPLACAAEVVVDP